MSRVAVVIVNFNAGTLLAEGIARVRAGARPASVGRHHRRQRLD